MITAIASLVLATSFQAEPKLEWGVFGEFAERLNEGSGYRLVMDKRVSNRPVVWYFSNPGEDKLALLKRCSKELCLNYEVDEELKKIFLIGPNQDAGIGLWEKIQASIQRAQTLIAANRSLPREEISKKAQALLKTESQTEDWAEKAAIFFDHAVLSNMASQGDRTAWAGLARVNAGQVAGQLADGAESIKIALTQSEIQMFESEYTRQGTGTEYDDLVWPSMKAWYEKLKADGATYQYELSATDDGSITMVLKMNADSDSQTMSIASLPKPGWLIAPATGTIKPELAKEEAKLKQAAFWGIESINDFQGAAIKNKWNTIGWLDSFHRNSLMTTLETMSRIFPVDAKVSEDGWLSIYRLGMRWPRYRGDWGAAIRMSRGLKEKMGREELLAHLNGVSDADLDGAATVRYSGFKLEVQGVFSAGWLLRAGLREARARKVKEFESGMPELGQEAGRDLSRFWPYAGPTLTTPRAVRQRGQLRFALLDRDMTDPDFDALPAERNLIVILTIPLGYDLPDGKPAVSFEQHSVILGKE